MEQDSYTLPNKEKIKLSEIYKIGKLKDKGKNRHDISFYKWSFTIRFNNRDKKNVEEPYHYSDWEEARIKLEKISNGIN